MVPPGSLSYFYSYDNQKTFTDSTNPTILNPQTVIANEHVTISVPKINYIENVDIL